MKDVFKGVLLIAIGLVAAIIVYPFTHELGIPLQRGSQAHRYMNFTFFLYRMYFAGLIL